jgi:hypothetical protein
VTYLRVVTLKCHGLSWLDILLLTFAEMNGPVDERLWIYFVIAVPLTAVIVGAWWMLDQRSVHGTEDDQKEAKAWIDKLESQIMTEIREKTGAHLRTMSLPPPLRQETGH